MSNDTYQVGQKVRLTRGDEALSAPRVGGWNRGITTSPSERIWAKVQPTGFCWEWTAFITPYGYGSFTPNAGENPVHAHRFAYRELVGAIPSDLMLDHLCRNNVSEDMSSRSKTRRSSGNRIGGAERA